MILQGSETLIPEVDPIIESDVSHLFSVQHTDNMQPVAEIEVKPKEQPHVSLGNYTASDSPRGFALQVSPKPEPDTIVTRIMKLGTDEKYKLILHIANYGSKTVCVEIWRQ